jgi:transglutaminase-like putative cysteine protease
LAEDLKPYMLPSTLVASDDVDVVAFAHRHAGNDGGHREQAIRLYYAVRDGIRYDPYTFSLNPDRLHPRFTLSQGRAWCVPKAILLAACCRAVGIPARMGFADVRNHLSTARMRTLMKTDIFYWHGYTAIYLDGCWIKATPAFNIELCHRFRIKPLEFDGCGDAIFHPFDLDGQLHMEYLGYRGEFTDVPIEQIHRTYACEYSLDEFPQDADFDGDVALETSVAGTPESHLPR